MMSYVSIARIGCTILLIVWGVVNVFWMVRRRASPAEFQGPAWLASALFAASGALIAIERRHDRGCAALGIVALACAVGWFIHIYRQSLHNTTM